MTELTKGNLTEGSITGTMLRFAWPLMLGNLLQQCYNIADTLIVGRVLGAEALAAVGSSYTLMIFITSIFIGLCMGCSAVGYTGIWWAVPIGWALADIVGVSYYQRIRQRLYRTAL